MACRPAVALQDDFCRLTARAGDLHPQARPTKRLGGHFAMATTAHPSAFDPPRPLAWEVAWLQLLAVCTLLIGLSGCDPQPWDRSDTGPAPLAGPVSPRRGPDEAAVSIVVVTDFRNPASRRLHRVLAEVVARSDEPMAVEFRHLPARPEDDYRLPHLAAAAAHDQSRFWEIHDLLFALDPPLSRRDVLQAARGMGLDVERLQADMASEAVRRRIESDRTWADEQGIDRAPMLLVAGHRVAGVPAEDDLEALIDRVSRGDEWAVPR